MPKLATAFFALAFAGGADAFAPRRTPVAVGRAAAPSALAAVSLPRLDLPPAVTSKMGEFGLANPNELDDAAYRSYSGAAVAGTLLALIFPGSLLFGLGEDLGAVLSGAFTDFAFSALLGGGLAIYLSLKGDDTGATVRGYGTQLLDAVGLPTLRYDIPAAVTDVMEGPLGLMNPNGLGEDDYRGYAGAAVAGTLAFFLLPGALVSGEFDALAAFAGAFLGDFAFAALVGGGACIYLSLRDDELGATVNSVGAKLLDTADDLLERVSS